MSIDIYTEQERIFLRNVLELFNVDFETETNTDTGVTCTVFSFKADESTQDIIKRCMLWNYKKNFR